jgi:hypothetical protein
LALKPWQLYPWGTKWERGKLEVKRVGEEIRTKTSSSTRVNKKGDEIRGGYSEQ